MHSQTGSDSHRPSSSHSSGSKCLHTRRSVPISSSLPLIVPAGGHSLQSHSAGGLSGSYRRPPVIPGGYGLPAVFSTSPGVSSFCLTRAELEDIEDDERRLLKDSNMITSYGAIQHDGRGQASIASSNNQKPLLHERVITGGDRNDEETTGLLSTEEVVSKWEDAVMAGKIHTTWQRESKVLARYSLPLVITFSLQYSLTIASILSAGNLGKNELAAASLAGMTGSITGYSVFQGRADNCSF